MAFKPPAFGTTSHTLVTPTSAGSARRGPAGDPNDRRPWIEHRIFVDGPPQSYWDEETKDFVTHRGQWQVIQTFGPFEDRDAATAFMVAQNHENGGHRA